jgi:hypothetical protein
MRNIGHVQVAVLVEARAFKKALDRLAGPIRIGPSTASPASEALRKTREDFWLDDQRRRVEGHEQQQSCFRRYLAFLSARQTTPLGEQSGSSSREG